jgi:hypothetical protein
LLSKLINNLYLKAEITKYGSNSRIETGLPSQIDNLIEFRLVVFYGIYGESERRRYQIWITIENIDI